MPKLAAGSKLGRRRRLLRAQGMFALAAAAFALAPAGAGAGTARVDSNRVEYRALPGERNAVSFFVSAARPHLVAIRDSAGIVPGVEATVILVTHNRKGRRVVRRRGGSAEDFPSSEFE